ncbi:MAG: NADPH-dependent F420 reductase [Methanosarcinales archaeon]|jgi:NADPH-dependent F420 reductase|nr:NADPH-dependent F420 reductase [Methanosarcinales archaeon]
MKIAILGGTGNLGKGFAVRWGQIHEVIVGSRDKGRAQEAAAEYAAFLKERLLPSKITGDENKAAAEAADIVVIAIRYDQIPDVMEHIKPALRSGQTVLSVVVPMVKDRCYLNMGTEPVRVDVDPEEYNADYFCYAVPKSGSAAKEIQALLPPGIDLVASFHNVSAKRLEDFDKDMDLDIAVCGNNKQTKDVIMQLVRDIPGLNPVDVGPLEAAALTEPITPLLLNAAKMNKELRHAGVKFV